MREEAYRQVDPDEVARSLPGVGPLGGPAIVAAMGRPGRFPSAGSFRRYSGLAPKASETGNSDAKGQPMSKAGASWLRDQLVMSANVARKIDPRTGPDLLRPDGRAGRSSQQGRLHRGAASGRPSLDHSATGHALRLRDIDGTEITLAEGKAIVPSATKCPKRCADADGQRKRGRPLTRCRQHARAEATLPGLRVSTPIIRRSRCSSADVRRENVCGHTRPLDKRSIHRVTKFRLQEYAGLAALVSD